MSLHDLKLPALSLVVSLLGGASSALWWTATDKARTERDVEALQRELAEIRGVLRERQAAVTKLEVVENGQRSIEAAQQQLARRVARCEARLFGLTPVEGEP